MNEWIDKDGYKTRLITNDSNLPSLGSEVQMVQFGAGKFEHFHKTKTEFFYFIKGSGKAVVDGKEITLEPGVELLIKPGVKHAFTNESDEILEALMFKTNSDPTDTFSV